VVVQIKLASLKGIKPHEYAVRFLFGGVVCVLAGLIADRFGAEIGGLFLAFPAIFPASASLVEAHEKRHKARVGMDGSNRGRIVAGVDAAGTALGCVGLAGFALVGSTGLPHWNLFAVFGLASLAWLLTGGMLWFLRKSRIFRRRHGQASAFGIFRTS
jgi:hypothetical protein